MYSPSHPIPTQRQSVRVGSEESVCRAPCPAASWKAVDFEVFGQVIAAGKLLFADDALVWFHSRVGAPVSGELVRPREPVRSKTENVIHESYEARSLEQNALLYFGFYVFLFHNHSQSMLSPNFTKEFDCAILKYSCFYS